MTTITSSGEDITDEIRAVWTHGADAYDLDAGHGLITPVVEDAWITVLKGLLGDEPLDVLDVGAGTGFLSVLAARAGHRVTGIDLTPAMLDHARERALKMGFDVDYIEGDAMDLPFADNRFDAVISRHVLWTMTEPDRAFSEWVRVTKPGGEVVWFDSLMKPRSPVNRARNLAARVARKLSRVDDHAHSHHYDADIIEHLPFRGLESTVPIREMLEGLGVTDVSCRALPRLQHAERSVMGLHKRLSAGSVRYVGRFAVTPEVKVAAARAG